MKRKINTDFEAPAIKFKKGDWCFCEFKLQQIERIENNEIMGVTDGLFSHGGILTDRCFPLELSIKRISDDVNYWSKQFHQLKNNALNHPQLNWKLIEMWQEMCINREDSEKLKELYTKLNAFGDAVVRKVQDLECENVQGIPIFRR
jgi:hypothetical protein